MSETQAQPQQQQQQQVEVAHQEESQPSTVPAETVIVNEENPGIVVIHIETPGGKTIRLEAVLKEMVIDLQMMLSELPDSCYYTCFYLTCNGTRLNEYATLENYNVFANATDVVHLKMVENTYDEAAARLHVRRVRDILANPPTHQVVFNPLLGGENDESKQKKEDALEYNPEERINFDVSLEKFDQVLASSLYNPSNAKDKPDCVKNVVFSAWNPPPGNRRLRGDLFYLEITTLENHVLHITSAADGFYLNNSTMDKFDPTPNPSPYFSHNLVDLLRKASQQFKARFNKLMSRKIAHHAFEVLPVANPANEWVNKPAAHTYNWNRAEEALLSTYGMDSRGVVRDWNTEYQEAHEQPFTTLADRVKRDRLSYQIYTQFVAAAVKGAMAVVQGHINPVNPGESQKSLVYLYNNIFFSFAVDMRGIYSKVGGDAVAYAMANHDLKGVIALKETNIPKLHVLAQCIVNYRGHRVVCQSVIPGIFHDKSSEHVYGTMDLGKSFKADPAFHKVMLEACRTLHIKEHGIYSLTDGEVKQQQQSSPIDAKSFTTSTVTVQSSENKDAEPQQQTQFTAVEVNHANREKTDIAGSSEMKGMKGFDNRYYLLDCIRITPRDSNFSDPHKHPAALLRSELVNECCRSSAVALLNKIVTEEKNAEQAAKNAKKEKSDDSKKTNTTTTTTTTTSTDKSADSEDAKDSVVAPSDAAARETKADEDQEPTELSKTLDLQQELQKLDAEAASQERKFLELLPQIAFNTDVFTATLLAGSKNEVQKDMDEVKAVGDFLQIVIVQLIFDFVSLKESPVDGASLSTVLHQRGINIRYLGRINEYCQKHLANHPQLQPIMDLTLREMITRAAKHLLNEFMRDSNAEVVDESSSTRDNSMFLGTTIAAFLSGLVGKHAFGAGLNDEQLAAASRITQAEIKYEEESKGRGKKSKKKPASDPIRLSDGTRASNEPLTAGNLWQRIRTMVSQKFNFKLPDRLDMNPRSKLSLLRAVCQATGVQLACKDYDLTAKSENPVTVDDIMDVLPVVKTTNPTCKDATIFMQHGKWELRNGDLQRAFQFTSAALDCFEQSLGPMHKDCAAAHYLMSQIFLEAREIPAAVDHQQKALIINQRVLGLDHFETARSHSFMARLLHTAGSNDAALAHIKRALYIFELIAGPNHHATVSSHVNLAVIYQSCGRSAIALKHLQEALNRFKLTVGSVHHYTALCYHTSAVCYSMMGLYREAIVFEKKAKGIWSSIFNSEESWVRKSAQWLGHFASSAVMLERGEVIQPVIPPVFWLTIPWGMVSYTTHQLALLEAQARSVEEFNRAVQHKQEYEELRRRIMENNPIGLEPLDIKQPKVARKKQAQKALIPGDKIKVTLEAASSAASPIIPMENNNNNNNNNNATTNGNHDDNSKKSKKKRNKKKNKQNAA